MIVRVLADETQRQQLGPLDPLKLALAQIYVLKASALAVHGIPFFQVEWSSQIEAYSGVYLCSVADVGGVAGRVALCALRAEQRARPGHERARVAATRAAVHL